MTNNDTKNLIERFLQTAYYYRVGKYVEESKEKAKLLYSAVLSIDNNNDRALYGLAMCNEVSSDAFIKYCEMSATLGNKDAQYKLGMYYAIEKDEYDIAIKWLTKSYENGDEDAMYSLVYIALCLIDGNSFDKNKALSIAQELYKKNRKEGAKLLGNVHYYSRYKDIRNHEKAIEYFKEAAILGCSDSAYYVACIYNEGKIPNSNPYDAAVWFEKAARMGDISAYDELRQIYSYDNKDRHFDYSDDDFLKLMEELNDADPEFCWTLMNNYAQGSLGKIDHRLSKHYRDKYIEYLNTLDSDEQSLESEDVVNQFDDIQNIRKQKYSGFFFEWLALPDERLKIMQKFEKQMDEEKFYHLELIRTFAQFYAGKSSPFYELIDDNKSEKMHFKDFTYSKDGISHTLESISPDGIPLDYKKAFELLEKGIALGDKGCEIILTNLLKETLEVL